MHNGILKILALLLFVVPAALAQNGTPTSSSSTADSGLASSASDSGGKTPQDEMATPASTASSIAPDATPGSFIRQLGTAFPLSAQPEGFKFGPLMITDISNSSFYLLSSAPGQATQNLWGNTTSAEIVYQHHTDRNTFAFQAKPQVSVTGDKPFLNEESGFAFTRQMSARWMLSATNQLSFLQNTQLVNPQNLLAYGNGGFYWQTLYAQQTGTAIYDSSNISMTYQMNGRTQVSLTPQVGVTVADQLGSANFVTYLGGGASINRNLSATRSVSFSYNFVHSRSSTNSFGSSGAWNTNTLGAGFRQQIGRSFWIDGNLSASYQSGQYSYWTPVGNIGISKSFHNGSMSLTYSRSQAAQVLLSSGYFDQFDFGYNHSFNRKFSTSMEGGAFRTVETGSHGTGKRIGGSAFYRWVHNLSWVASYNYSTQSGNQPTLNLGNTTYISFGLNWNPGQAPNL
jgi:hypothetical protein